MGLAWNCQSVLLSVRRRLIHLASGSSCSLWRVADISCHKSAISSPRPTNKPKSAAVRSICTLFWSLSRRAVERASRKLYKCFNRLCAEIWQLCTSAASSSGISPLSHSQTLSWALSASWKLGSSCKWNCHSFMQSSRAAAASSARLASSALSHNMAILAV